MLRGQRREKVNFKPGRNQSIALAKSEASAFGLVPCSSQIFLAAIWARRILLIDPVVYFQVTTTTRSHCSGSRTVDLRLTSPGLRWQSGGFATIIATADLLSAMTTFSAVISKFVAVQPPPVPPTHLTRQAWDEVQPQSSCTSRPEERSSTNQQGTAGRLRRPRGTGTRFAPDLEPAGKSQNTTRIQ